MSIVQQLARAGARQISTSAGRQAAQVSAEVPKGYIELKKVQDRFQKKDGKPVFLKGGGMDQLLYRFTMGLSLVGVGGILKLIYELSCPSKPE